MLFRSHYYLTEGRDDPLRIAIPKGHYFAAIQAGPAHATDEAPSIDRAVPSIRRQVRSSIFLNVLVGCLTLLMIGGLVAMQLGLFSSAGPVGRTAPVEPRIAVLPFESGTDPEAVNVERRLTNKIKLALCCDARYRVVPPTMQVDYRVEGVIRAGESALMIEMLLKESNTGTVLWTRTYTLDQPDMAIRDVGVIEHLTRELANVARQ